MFYNFYARKMGRRKDQKLINRLKNLSLTYETLTYTSSYATKTINVLGLTKQ